MIRLDIGHERHSVHYESDDFLRGLAGSYHAIGDIPFSVLGIDAAEVRRHVSGVKGSSIAEIIANIKWKGLEHACPHEYRPICESIAFECAVERCLSRSIVVPKVDVGDSVAKSAGKISLMSCFKEWVVVKKMNTEGVGEREVAAFLLGLKASLLQKYVERVFSAGDAEKMGKLLSGKRRGLAGLEILMENTNEGKRFEDFVVGAMILGYSATPTPAALKKMFPEQRMPAMRGRRPK